MSQRKFWSMHFYTQGVHWCWRLLVEDRVRSPASTKEEAVAFNWAIPVTFVLKGGHDPPKQTVKGWPASMKAALA